MCAKRSMHLHRVGDAKTCRSMQEVVQVPRTSQSVLQAMSFLLNRLRSNKYDTKVLRSNFFVLLVACTGLLHRFADEASGKDVVVLFDGTWNNSVDYEGTPSKLPALFKPDAPLLITDANQLLKDGSDSTKLHQAATNIARMFSLLENTPTQSVAYVRGVGTDGAADRVQGGAFGEGAKDRINSAYEYIDRKYKDGDQICLFGFSRGAAIARQLAIKLDSTRVQNAPKFQIRFMGLFDTVAAFGFPNPRFESDGFRKEFESFFSKLAIPDSVERVVHLVSLDEERVLFLPTLISRNPTNTVSRKEIWFGGNHGDVGGGWSDEDEKRLPFRRRQITLRYMLEESHGLAPVYGWERSDDVKVDESASPNYGTKHEADKYRFRKAFSGIQERIPVSGNDRDYAIPYDPRKHPEVIHESALK